MYADTNFRTKKAFKDAVKSGVKVGVFQPNNFFNVEPKPNSTVAVCGPHYPEAHKWYATVTLDAECNVVKVS